MRTVPDLVAELTIHGILASLLVEGAIRFVPVTAPETRFLYRLTALALPAVLWPVLAQVPFRYDPAFQEASLFVSSRWAAVTVGPIDVRTAAAALAAVAGSVLLGRDLFHGLRHLFHSTVRGDERTVPDPLRAGVRQMSAELGINPPHLLVIPSDRHGLYCRTGRVPTIVLTTSTIATLDEEELRAAVAHELVHLRHRDVAWSWVLLGLRLVQAVNPVAQLTGRRAAQDLEFHADDRAGDLTSAPLALAKALIKCARHRGDEFLGLAGRGRLHNLERRCGRLIEPGIRFETGHGGVAAAWLALSLLLLFVQ